MRIPFTTRPPARPPPPIEPASRSECFSPCERRPPLKPCLLTTHWKPLPFDVPETVTISPSAKSAIGDSFGATTKVTGKTSPVSEKICVISTFLAVIFFMLNHLYVDVDTAWQTQVCQRLDHL